jgi:LacI family transcriptional regulator
MPKLLSIGLFLPGGHGFFSDVMMGVKEFARNRWAIEMGSGYDNAQGLTSDWRPDGMLLSCYGGGDWQGLISRVNVPVVLIGGDALPQYPRVLSDDHAIGRVAGDYFIQRTFRNYAYCGYDQAWSHRRERGYREVLTAAGFEPKALRAAGGQMHVRNVSRLLADWVRQLPKPVAVFCCHDRVARFVSNACAYAGIAVPDDVSILGVDNDPFECDLTTPPISSIMGSARRLGYQAAELLEKLISGAAPPKAPLLIAPAGVEERGSSDLYAIDDPDVLAALRYIRAHADSPMSVDAVAKGAIITRRMLERKFLKLLNRSPRMEILRAHIECAKDLLIHTNDSALQVALGSGFLSGSKFSEIFKRETGLTPSAFRKLYGASSRIR